jgi:hypothetical protein
MQLFFCGGVNVVGNINTQMVLKYITDFVKDSSHTNIILQSVPHRHDMMKSSCVNNEIRSENEWNM